MESCGRRRRRVGPRLCPQVVGAGSGSLGHGRVLGQRVRGDLPDHARVHARARPGLLPRGEHLPDPGHRIRPGPSDRRRVRPRKLGDEAQRRRLRVRKSNDPPIARVRGELRVRRIQRGVPDLDGLFLLRLGPGAAHPVPRRDPQQSGAGRLLGRAGVALRDLRRRRTFRLRVRRCCSSSAASAPCSRCSGTR